MSRWCREVLVDSGMVLGIGSFSPISHRIVPPLDRNRWLEVGVGRQGNQSPFQVRLTASERKLLKVRVRAPTAQYRQVLRARIVLAASAGLANAQIARRLGVAVNTARKWRQRFSTEGLAGLTDRPRPGQAASLPSRGGRPRQGD